MSSVAFCELQVIVQPGEPQHDAAVAFMPFEAIELAEPKAVTIEGNRLLQLIRRSCDSNLHHPSVRKPEALNRSRSARDHSTEPHTLRIATRSSGLGSQSRS